jgi:hypothetical protein
MKNKIIFGVVLVMFSVLSGVGGYFFFRHEQASQVVPTKAGTEENVSQKTEGYRAQLDYTEGQVEKRANTESGWLTAESGDIFTSGMEVRTLVGSKAIVTFEDGSIARLDENTQVKIATGKDSINLEMARGIVFNRVAKVPTRQYVVDSGNYSMRALGTIFSVANINGNDPELLVLESQVEMKKSGDTVADVAVAGEKIAVMDNKAEKKNIEDKDLEKKFLSWNIDKDKMEVKLEKKKEVKKEETKTTSETASDSYGKISLSGKDNDNGIRLTWSADGLGDFDGFKLVKSKNANPVYPGDSYQYFSGSGTKAYTWEITDGEKYHFRVCKYVGGKCTLYSNDVFVHAPEKGSSKDDDSEDYATSVSLSGSKDGDAAKLSWSISGGGAPLGFKVVKSKDKNPVYPGDTYQYFSDSGKRSYNWSGFDSGDSYHFRVCIYKGGSCGAYSNDVEISF